MSEDMSSWRYLSAASSRVKSYLAQRDSKNLYPRTPPVTPGGDKQSWREWAGQKIYYRRDESESIERIALFPGWAARRYTAGTEHNSFSVEIYVSGYASVHRAPEFASRSQRAFMRLARGYAALPKLAGETETEQETMISQPLSPSTEDLLATVKLPPPPSHDAELEALERQFAQLHNAEDSDDDTSSLSSHASSSRSQTPSRPTPDRAGSTLFPNLASDLRKLHANLEARLTPFWSSVLPERTVEIHLFASPSSQDSTSRKTEQAAISHGSIASRRVQTLADGSFEARFHVSWEDLCQHPAALHIAFGEHDEEHDFVASAEILKAPMSRSTPDLRAEAHETPVSVPTKEKIALTHAPIRVISDIDDTVKKSDVLGGTRAIFHNVFVRELDELILPGVGEWYTSMWKRGVRFHYVSNGPFELLPVLAQFFGIAGLPPGSLKLKSYAGRSLFTGFLSAPASRKRAGVVDILNSFDQSKFILIGDTGEQDLELYAELAAEKPDQIIAIFIRDADAGVAAPLDDPLGKNLTKMKEILGDVTLATPRPARSTLETPRPLRAVASVLTPTTYASRTPRTPSRSVGGGDYFGSARVTEEPEPLPASASQPTYSTSYPPRSRRSTNASTISTVSSLSSRSLGSMYAKMSDQEKRRYDLQIRVYRARRLVPDHIPLRVFQSPEECEAEASALVSSA